MSMTDIIQLINGVGFPIVVSIALFYNNLKQDERYQEIIKELQDVINNNTKSLSELNTSCNIKNGRSEK